MTADMETAADVPVQFGGRNPDVLTCIANLSNDEVFTPPELANQMLDALENRWSEVNGGETLWASPTVTFLDPFTKSGVFLREITKRLVEGLADELPDIQKRVDHILTNQVFGVAVTELTALLARRSLYCSKWADGEHSIATTFDDPDGNVWFERIEHAWEDPKAKDSRCVYCGTPRSALDRGDDSESYAYAFIHTDDIHAQISEWFGDNMQFDVIIGNPPYQLDDGGHGTSAAPIYDRFVEQAKALNPRFLSMIIPSRWFSGGKHLDDFRESMLSDDRLRSIDDYLSASDVFPQIGLKGGVCYFLWDRDHPGDCRITTRYKDWEPSTSVRPLLEPGADVFVRFNEGLSILKKVIAVENPTVNTVTLPTEKRFDGLVSSLRPFGLRTFFRGRAKAKSGDVVVYQNGGTAFVSRDELTGGEDLVDHWKVYIGRAGPGTGNKDTYPHRILSTPFIGEPKSVSSETYLCIGPLKTKTEAESVLSYLHCRLTRLLVLLHKPSADTTRKVYKFVPTQTWDRIWTDGELYEKYGITDAEIDFIESVVRPMADED